MLIQIKENIPGASGRKPFTGDGVLIGLCYHTHRDGPIEVDDKKGAELIKLGIANAVSERETARAQKAVEPRMEAQRR